MKANGKNAEEAVVKLACHIRSLVVLSLLLVVCILVIIQFPRATPSGNTDKPQKATGTIANAIPEDFEIQPFDNTPEGKLAEYGYRLITETYALIGPETSNRITGNGLACGSCHLKGGTKPFAAPYIGLSGIFPFYIGREDKIVSLEERINGCLERSMNGKAIDVSSEEMRAIITYIKHISKDVPVGERLEGQGFVAFNVPGRAANVEQGAVVFRQNCASCHGADGEGIKGTDENKKGGYLYPPLWGPDSYNDGAGMARLLTAAKFIKGNMPLGVTHENPLLTDEEAYDVAAYINSHTRPEKSHKEKDYPDLKKKPKDCPYPPYADNIPQQQHQYGPFNFGK